MYYRRKILLSLLQTWGGKLSNISFQKLLFLFCQQQDKSSFHFVPYKYGCFSFQSYADRRALVFYNILANNNSWHKIDEKDYCIELFEKDKKALAELKKRFIKFSQDDLISYIYKNYPYYAINSEILNYHLTENEIDVVNKNIELCSNPCLSTIGYEGLTIEQYLNKLIRNNIKCIIDVRKNPISMKFGFSRHILHKYLNKLKIEYYHFPQLGIESQKRKNLTNKQDYNILFDEYAKETIPNNLDYINKILELVHEYNRIALTCFESHHTSCHRHKIIDYINNSTTENLKILHL